MRSFINATHSSMFLPHYVYYSAVAAAAIAVVIVAVVRVNNSKK